MRTRSPPPVRIVTLAEQNFESGRHLKCSGGYLNEVALFPEDESLLVGHGEILERVRVCPEARPVAFVRGKRVKCNQRPRDVIRPLVREEIPDEMAAASRNNRAPVLRVPLEPVMLMRVDLVPDYTGDQCCRLSCRHRGCRLTPEGRRGKTRNCTADDL